MPMAKSMAVAASFRARAPHGSQKTAKPSKGQRIIQDAIAEALDTSGKTIIPRVGMPTVKAAKVNDVRAEFDRRYVTGEADPLKGRQRQAHGIQTGTRPPAALPLRRWLG